MTEGGVARWKWRVPFFPVPHPARGPRDKPRRTEGGGADDGVGCARMTSVGVGGDDGGGVRCFFACESPRPAVMAAAGYLSPPRGLLSGRIEHASTAEAGAASGKSPLFFWSLRQASRLEPGCAARRAGRPLASF